MYIQNGRQLDIYDLMTLKKMKMLKYAYFYSFGQYRRLDESIHQNGRP